jgi:phosphoribosylamine--glycine ligase
MNAGGAERVKVLVVGQGAREHALAWKMAQSALVSAVHVAPGNAGTGAAYAHVPIPATDVQQMAAWAERARIDLTVVGPEAALAVGMVDAFRARGLRIFGPTQAAARLETSKAFAKAFMARHGIPTAAFQDCLGVPAATDYLASLAPERYPLVIKADGLAAGKGVRIVADHAEARAAVREAYTELGSERFVIEEFLRGFEVSLLAVVDGTVARPLATAHDYKYAHDGDTGPMTGGMGAYSPVAGEAALTDTVMRSVVRPVVAGMAAEGSPYTGILYAGLMLTETGPRVLEFNVRFGDPETQVLLPRWQDDLAAVLLAVTDSRLADFPPFRWSAGAACGVVLASAGYPAASRIGVPIHGLEEAGRRAVVFHAGTSVAEGAGGAVVTAGGRVLTVVAEGDTLDEARRHAYDAAAAITFAGGWSRQDIAVPRGAQESTGSMAGGTGAAAGEAAFRETRP